MSRPAVDKCTKTKIKLKNYLTTQIGWRVQETVNDTNVNCSQQTKTFAYQRVRFIRPLFGHAHERLNQLAHATVYRITLDKRSM